MRGLTKAAAFLLAPALARASSMSLDKSWTVVNLDIPPGNHDVDSLALRLNIQETDEICGPTRLLVNGHYLEQNEDGFGSGVVPVGEDILMTAHWLFSCVTDDNGPAAKLMRFTIDKLDGEPTSDLDFAMTFRQTTPAIVLELGGAAVTEPWIPIESADGQQPGEEMPDPDDELEAQIHELELLRVQVDSLMDLIHTKEMAIRERLGNQGDHGPPRPPPPPPIFIMLQDCNSVQCVVRTLTDKVKHTAGHFYGDFFKAGHGPPPEHESDYSWAMSGERQPHRGDGGHHKPPGFPGNHSRPFPPPPPPFCPPCHDAPPPPPPPPHHGSPPPEDGERPPLRDGDRPVPPDHDDDLPLPPKHGEHSHLPGHGDDSPRPDHPHHGDHGPPEHGDHPHPPHDEPPFDSPHDGKPGDDDFDMYHPPMASEDDEGHPPPPPHEHGPHGHGRHGPGGHHHPPPPPVFMSFGVAAIALALFSVIGLGYIHRRANRLNPGLVMHFTDHRAISAAGDPPYKRRSAAFSPGGLASTTKRSRPCCATDPTVKTALPWSRRLHGSARQPLWQRVSSLLRRAVPTEVWFTRLLLTISTNIITLTLTLMVLLLTALPLTVLLLGFLPVDLLRHLDLLRHPDLLPRRVPL